MKSRFGRAHSRAASPMSYASLRRARWLASAAIGISISVPATAQVIDYANGEDKTSPIQLTTNTTQLQTLAGVTATQSGVISQDILGRPLEKIGAGALILTAGNTYTGVTTISAGTLQIGNGGTTGAVGGDIVNNGALVFNRSNDIGFGGLISGTGTLTKNGDGNLILGTNLQTYTGGTTINDGAIVLESGAAFLPAGGNLVVNGACQTTDLCGIFDLNGNDQTIGDLSGTGGIIRVVDAAFTVGTSNSTTFAGNISETAAGTSALIKQGSGTLTLTGTTVIDTITVSAGTLRISDGGSTNLFAGDVTGNIDNGAALVFDSSGGQDVAGDISGSGTLTKLGSGTLTLHGVNTYTGDTTISAGALIVKRSLTSDVINNAQLRFHPEGVGNTVTYDGVISGTGFVTKFEGGTLVLTAAQTYSGGTTIDAGTIQLAAGGALPTNGALTINAGTFDLNGNNQTIGDLSGAGNITLGSGTLTAGASGSTTFGGVISGTGGLVKQGTGTLTLISNQTYTGGTTISAGTLQIGNGGNTGSVAGNIVNNATLAFNRANFVYDGVISGSGSLVKTGSGSLTLTGSSTYAGATVINGGILLVNGSIASSAVTVNSSGTLGGTGTVGGATIGTGGKLSPGNSIGTITVSGNLSFNSSAEYVVEVSDTQADRTNVIGSATLAGTMTLVPIGSGNFTVGTEYTLLTATGGLTGTFNDQLRLFGEGIQGTVLYDDNAVVLRLDPFSFSELLPDDVGDNESEVASALDVIFANANTVEPDLSNVAPEFLVLLDLSPAAVGEALSEISGEIGVSNTQGQFQSLLQYLSLLLDETPGGRARLAPMRQTALGDLAVWAALQGDQLNIRGSASEGTNDLDSQGGQFALGLDLVRPAGVLGFSVAIGKRDSDLEGIGSASNDTFQAGAHSRIQFNDFYVSGSAAYASFDVSTERTVSFTGSSDQYLGDFTAHGFGGRVEAGRPFATMWGALTPFANLSAERITTPDYDESTTAASDALALHHDDTDSDRARTELGLEAAARLNTAGSVTANLRVAWAHEFIRDHTARASFQSFPTAFFQVQSPQLDANAAVVGAGLSVYLGERTALRFNVSGEFGSRSESYSGFIGLHTSW